MKRFKKFIFLLGILISVVVVSIVSSKLVSNGFTEATRYNYFERNLKGISSFDQFKTVLSLILLGAKGTFLIILSVGIVQYLLAVPLGFYATNKNGIFKLLIIGFNGFFSRIPPIISAIIFINLPFVLFSTGRFGWAIFILAFIGVGQVSHRIYGESVDAYKTEFVEAGKKKGYRGIYLILYCVFPVVFPSIASHFFKDLGKTTILLAQLGIFNIFISKKINNTGLGFGQLLNTDYNWTTMLGNTTKVVVHAPLAPLVPVLAFVLTIFLFNLMGESLQNRSKSKVESSSAIIENHTTVRSM